MFNDFKIKWESEMTYPQFREIVKYVEIDLKSMISILDGVSYIHYHGDNGDFAIKIDYYELTISISII